MRWSIRSGPTSQQRVMRCSEVRAKRGASGEALPHRGVTLRVLGGGGTIVSDRPPTGSHLAGGNRRDQREALQTATGNTRRRTSLMLSSRYSILLTSKLPIRDLRTMSLTVFLPLTSSSTAS